MIPSNLIEFANYRKFIEHRHYGIKGLLIDQDQIYVSLIYELKKGCYNTSIFVAKLNFKKLEFEKFFSPDTCVDENDDIQTYCDIERNQVREFAKEPIRFLKYDPRPPYIQILISRSII